MEITTTYEGPDGQVKFSGTLEGAELTLVVETGLNELMKRGLVPFVATETFDLMDIHEPPTLDQ